jgi:hypothetical protein
MKWMTAAAVAVLVSVSSARADEFSDKVRAAAQDEANELGECAGTASRRIETATMSAEEIAYQSYMACEDKIRAVTIALEGPPASLSPADAEDITNQIVAGGRANLADLIKRERQ